MPNSLRRRRLTSRGIIGQARRDILNQWRDGGRASGGEINWFIKFRYLIIIFIISFQMCHYLLILFVCEYGLLLCNTFDFASSPAVIQSIMDTLVSPNANQRSRIGFNMTQSIEDMWKRTCA